MPQLTMAAVAAAFVLSEANGNRSRAAEFLGANQDVTPGEILARMADDTVVAWNPAGADGSEVAACLPLYAEKTGAGETKAIATIARDAEVKGDVLAWPAGVTAEQKAAAIGQLAIQGIIVR